MRLRFTKMHSLGNDFIVIDGLTQHVRLTAEMVHFLADRRLGVGAQQVLVVEAPSHPDMDFRCRLFNSDGSDATDYRHAAYCLAKFVWDRRLTAKQTLRLETLTGPSMTLEGQKNGQVTIDLGVPQLRLLDGSLALDFGDQRCEITMLSIGHTYAITVVPSTLDASLEALANRIQQHEYMPEGVNVGFIAVLSRREIELRVLLHDGAEAPACTSSACAGMVAGRMRGLLDEQVKVMLADGNLTIRWKGEGRSVQASNLATTVYQGQLHL